MTTDNKDQDSRLPDYALKISRVFIHICLFIPLIIILRLKLDTFNSEERGTAEEEPMYQWSLTSNLRREIGKKTVYQYGGSWKIWMYFNWNFVWSRPCLINFLTSCLILSHHSTLCLITLQSMSSLWFNHFLVIAFMKVAKGCAKTKSTDIWV